MDVDILVREAPDPSSVVSPTPGHRARPLGLVLVGLLAFVLARVALDRSLTPELAPRDEVAAKLAWLAADAGPADVLVVGSSTIHRGFVPEVFDAELAAGGRPVRSLNVGVRALHGLETAWFLDQVAELRPAGVRWVIVAPEALSFRLADPDRTRRVRRWHDARRSAFLFTMMLEPGRELDERRRAVAKHYEPIAARLVGHGDGSRAIEERVSPGRGRRHEGMGARGDGYAPIPGTTPGQRERRRLFLADLDGYRADVATMAADPDPSLPPLRASEAAYLADLERSIRAIGAEPIFTTTPRSDPARRESLYLRAAARAGSIRLIELDRPDLYPEVYAIESRFDPGHTNDRGARELTRVLAERFLALIVADAERPR